MVTKKVGLRSLSVFVTSGKWAQCSVWGGHSSSSEHDNIILDTLQKSWSQNGTFLASLAATQQYLR